MTRPWTGTVGVFILAKNEEENIARALAALATSGWDVCVLDSGSSDRTKEIVAEHAYATIRDYRYTSHANAYNFITADLGATFDFAIVIDADMIVDTELQNEIAGMVSDPARTWTVLDADVEMYSNGVALRRASLYPPKPFLFKTGERFFIKSGHGERVVDGAVFARVKTKLQHDDRKNYGRYLESQFRYANKLFDHYLIGDVSHRDVMRIRSPLLILLVPLFSLIVKRGFIDGRAGLIYALDRLIAEAIMYRQGLARRDEKRRNEP